MTELVRFGLADGGSVVVEADDESGVELASRDGSGIAAAQARFADALTDVRTAAAEALRVLRDDTLSPDAVELEFGVKLTAQAGAVIAKTALEGHLKVKLTWGTPPLPTPEPPEAGASA